MSNLTISIFCNKIFLEILDEVKLFSKFKIEYYKDLDLCLKDAQKHNFITVLFLKDIEKNFSNKNTTYNFPLLIIADKANVKSYFSSVFCEKLNMPFSILNFKKKVVSLISKHEFKKNSVIQLGNYIIDKNERKIKKDNLELQLSEKEINFLVLFSINNKPINRDEVLKKVWNYSSQIETHTLETHIHRLRKKIFAKFKDNNFIKNNNYGYYI